MTDVQHGALQPGAASGIHVIHHWSVANLAARDALTLSDAEVGKVCKQIDTSPATFWLLVRMTGGVAWLPLGGAGMTTEQSAALTGAIAAIAALRTPEYVVAALTGELSAERVAEGAGPVSVSFATAQKMIITVATALGGGSPAAGLMSAADKVALDAAVSKLASLPAALTIDTTTIPPANTDAGAAGSGTAVAPITHRHPHGTGLAGGTTHATAIGGGSPAAGFMSGADKVAHDANTAALPNKAEKALTDNPQAGAYTLPANADDLLTRMTSATSVALTVPPVASVSTRLEAPINVVRYGTGVITITAGAGVTLLPANNLRLANQYDWATLVRVSADTWLVKGEVVV